MTSASDPRREPMASPLFNWLFLTLGGVTLVGGYLDSWAHHRFGDDLDTFFTPWHALLYGGYLSVLLLLLSALLGNLVRHRGRRLRELLPREYHLSLYGISIIVLSGPADLVWHEIFGIESDITAVVSPPHLALLAGSMMMALGPSQKLWWRQTLPMPRLFYVLLLAYALLLVHYATDYLHAFINPWHLRTFATRYPVAHEFQPGLGIGNSIYFGALSVGFFVTWLRYMTFPFGGFALVLALDAVFLASTYNRYYWSIPCAIAAGLVIDAWYLRIRTRVLERRTLRTFGFLVPVIVLGLHMIVGLRLDAPVWPAYLMFGSVLMGGLAGYFLTFLIVPPGADRAVSTP